MIRPPGRPGVAFTQSSDGDQRNDLEARRSVSESLGLSDSWATVRQVHGALVVEAMGGGGQGEADALWTRQTNLPLGVFTADCFGVVLHSPGAVGVAHVGWRGVRAGVVTALRSAMTEAGNTPTRAAIGPGIGPCCFEVGDDVASLFPSFRDQTSWHTPSVDLEKALWSQVEGLESWVAGACTMHDEGWFSHRRDGTRRRLATIGWLP